MIDCFIDYIEKDQLGQIASAHLVTADAKGLFQNDTEWLAKIHSHAVDFAKTGHLPDEQRLISLYPRQKPDFTEDPRKPSYKSKRLLGELYR